MKKFIYAATVLAAMAATPAFAGGTHISFGVYTPAPVYYQPAPVYYQPAPVVYYPPVRHVYYAPAPRYYQAYNYGRGRGHGMHRGYNTAWNDRGWNDRDGGRGRH